MNTKNLARRIFGLVLAALIVFTLPAWSLFPKKTYDFDVKLDAGYKSTVLYGKSAPFKITITGKNSSNFEGYLQMIVPGFENHNILYEEEITLGASESKTIEIVAGIPVPSKFVNVRVTDKKHNVVWSQLQDLNVAKDMNEIRVGVLTDDFSALGYMDRQRFLSQDNRMLTLIELDSNKFPTEYYALEMLDVILITDYSTDILTTDQISALNRWVSNGGFLIVGTGSTANKTLSGLKGKIITDNVSSTTSIKTTLGIKDEDYIYLTSIPTQSYNQSSSSSTLDFYYNYHDPDDYYYQSTNDYDGDGLTDAYHNDYGGDYKGDDYYDAYNQLVDPSYLYLYDGSGFDVDSNNEYHYQFYNERYGVVDEDQFDFIYNDYYSYYDEDFFSHYAYNEYCNLWGFDPRGYIYESSGFTLSMDEVEKQFEAYFGSDYEEYLKHYQYLYMFYEYYGIDLRPDLSQASNTTTTVTYNAVDVDVCGISDADTTADYVYGDNGSSQFVFAKISDFGDGKVAICAVDFTKNPLPKCGYAGEVFRNLIERTIGLEFVNEANEYEKNYSNNYYYSPYGYNYNLMDLLGGTTSAPLPPTLLYGLFITLYLVSILVTYLVLLKKKKTFELWKVYPIVAVCVSILIFCVGFSTRVLRLELKTIAIITPDAVTTKEVDYVGAVIPKAKEYVVDFSSDVEVDRNFSADDDHYSYFYNNEVDYDAYTVRYVSGYDSFQSVITNKIPLETQYFKAETSYLTQGGLEITYISDPNKTAGGKTASNIQITNNYSTTLEDVIVQLYDISDGYKEYYFSSIKAGETVTVKDGKYLDYLQRHPNTTSYLYSSYKNNFLAENYSDEKGLTYIAGFFLGSIYKDFNEALVREKVYAYVETEYKTSDTDVLVVAFPKSNIGAKVINGKKAKTHKTEAIILFKDKDEIEVK